MRRKVGNGYASKVACGYVVYAAKTGPATGLIEKIWGNYYFRVYGQDGWHASGTRAEAVDALLAYTRSLKRAKAYRKAHPKCVCREPKKNRHCAYCGWGGDGISVCGVCRESGIDGPAIRGTGRVVCRIHKEK
jgi:hypothetical protein